MGTGGQSWLLCLISPIRTAIELYTPQGAHVNIVLFKINTVVLLQYK